MHRWTAPLLATLLMALPLSAQDNKSEKKDNDREQQFKELRDSFEKARREAIQAFRQAKTDEERKAAFDKYQNPGKQAAQVLKLIEADPKGDLAFRMLAWELQATGGREPKVFDLLARHHAKNPSMAALCRMLTSMSVSESAPLLRKVLEENPEKPAKGCACYALAQLADNEAIKDPSKTDEAEKLYQRIETEFADVKSGRGPTLGELAKVEAKLLIGKTAPPIESENLKGDKVQLKDLRGKVVVLDIWATWCGPCRAMIPHEREMVKKLKSQPFALVSISFDKDKETLKKFLDREEMPWTHWWNGAEGGISKDYNIEHFPTIYVLDGKGIIRYKEIRGEKLEKAVEKLVAEAKDKK